MQSDPVIVTTAIPLQKFYNQIVITILAHWKLLNKSLIVKWKCSGYQNKQESQNHLFSNISAIYTK